MNSIPKKDFSENSRHLLIYNFSNKKKMFPLSNYKSQLNIFIPMNRKKPFFTRSSRLPNIFISCSYIINEQERTTLVKTLVKKKAMYNAGGGEKKEKAPETISKAIIFSY